MLALCNKLACQFEIKAQIVSSLHHQSFIDRQRSFEMKRSIDQSNNDLRSVANGIDSIAASGFQLDAKGLACPLPLLRTKQMLNRLQAGQQMSVLATDPGTWRDIPAFCQLAGHSLLERVESSGVYRFVIEKKSE